MSLGTNTNHLGWTTVTSLLVVLNLDTWDPYLPRTEEIKNIPHGVIQARKIVSALNGVWWSKDVTENRKKKIYNNIKCPDLRSRNLEFM